MRKADNLPPSCAVVKKSGTLNFLETSGPLQACNGTDFQTFRFPRNFVHVRVIQLVLRIKSHTLIGLIHVNVNNAV